MPVSSQNRAFRSMKSASPVTILTLLFALMRPTGAQDWQFECIDSTLGPAHHHRMVLDQQNLPHIFFYNSDNGHLMQYYKSDSEWNLVDYSVLFVPEGIDVDSDDGFHLSQGGENVVYYMFTNQDTTYLDTIYVGNIPTLFSGIRIGNNGLPHIIAVSYDTGVIFHIKKENYIWEVEQVLTFFPYLAGLSVSIDSSDAIHLGLTGNIPVAVGYAHDDPDWFYSVLVDGGAYGNVRIDLGAAQRPALTYNFHYTGGGFHQALLEFNGSSWDTTFFDTSFSSTSALPFAHDPNNRPHLILYKGEEPPENSAMIHTYRTNNSWLYDTVMVGPFLPQDFCADSESDLHLHLSGVDHRGLYYGKRNISTRIQDHPVPIESNIEILECYPNPFNDNLTMVVRVNEGTRELGINVIDLQGRVVKKLKYGLLRENHLTIMWDGTNHFNETVASGVYFIRIADGTNSKYMRVVLLR